MNKNSYFSYSDLLKKVSPLIKTGLPQYLPYFDLGPHIHELLSEPFVSVSHAKGSGSAEQHHCGASPARSPAIRA
jgi:hypothetical protein